MFYLSVRLSKQKILFLAAAVSIAVFLCFSFYKSASGTEPNGDTFEKRAVFLYEFGFDISNCEESEAEVVLPDKDDSKVLNYNKLQLCCGFDLLPYCQKTVNRYSYSLPADKKVVSIIVANGAVVGGDILDTDRYEYMPLCGGELNGENTD